MSDFDAFLTRSFAEEHHEPADDGFSVTVAKGVARREISNQVMQSAVNAGMAAAAAAVAFGLWSFGSAVAPEIQAALGLELARAHGAVSTTPDFAAQASTLWSSMSAGLTQVLFVAAALVGGGAVAYRTINEQ
ncbi:hypothetical protein [Terricaulis sp.]|uniref:hypothetical protein n=1 Tax=Terricaulis sp. TaxID=2768686 RepID=UPI00378453E1